MSTVSVDSLLIERPAMFNTPDYNVAEVIIPNAPTEAGSGAGAAVTTSFEFSEANLPADLNYTIEASASQACAISWANKSTTGFDIVQTPLAAGDTLAEGTVDVVVTWSNG